MSATVITLTNSKGFAVTTASQGGVIVDIKLPNGWVLEAVHKLKVLCTQWITISYLTQDTGSTWLWKFRRCVAKNVYTFCKN